MIPNRPLDSRSTITAGPDGTQISIPEYKSIKMLLLFLGTFFWLITGAAVWIGIQEPMDKTAGLVLVLMFLLPAVGFTIAGLRSPTVILLMPNRLVVRKNLCGITWTHCFDASEIFDLKSWWIGEDVNARVSRSTGIFFTYRGKDYRFCVNRVAKDEADYLVAQIQNCYPRVNVIARGPLENMGLPPRLFQ